jgi:hypothetical protein
MEPIELVSESMEVKLVIIAYVLLFLIASMGVRQ